MWYVCIKRDKTGEGLVSANLLRAFIMYTAVKEG
jgi:hypothetical protein